MTNGLADLVRVLAAFPRSDLVELDPDDKGGHALAYGLAGHEIFPTNGKVPIIPSAHQRGDPLRGRCHGECGRDGHGFYDATSDLERIARWWGRYPNADIGERIPDSVSIVDIDPRQPGALEALNRALSEHGPINTLTAWSGRGDLGRHLWFERTVERLSRSRAPKGWDLKTSGLVVLPPSEHPVTRGRYRWDDPDQPIAPMPAWMVDMLRAIDAPAPVAAPGYRRMTTILGDSIADWYTAEHTWSDVLTDWTLVSGDGEDDGSAWRHPTASSALSATIRHGCLFVYSTSTAFEPTDGETTHGYTKFKAWATLEHGGDMSAAAREARHLRGVAA
jgi:hypothetical protein